MNLWVCIWNLHFCGFFFVRWKIKAIAEIETEEEIDKTFRNKKGEGRKFAVTFRDSSGEIRAIAFDHAEIFESQIENGKVNVNNLFVYMSEIKEKIFVVRNQSSLNIRFWGFKSSVA
jgi:hypothetical protein